MPTVAYYLASTFEGIDLEAIGKLEFYPHYLEIMQAFALSQERNYRAKPLFQEDERLKNEMKEIGELMMSVFRVGPRQVLDIANKWVSKGRFWGLRRAFLNLKWPF